LGLKIKLPNGNVASRVLPVRIYDLSGKEVESCEAVSGGVLRGIDFVFKSPGVNRPLRANEDHPGDNLNKTYYRDQINKVANSIKEIFDACGDSHETLLTKPEKNLNKPVMRNSARMKILTGSLILLAVLSTGIFWGSKFLGHNEVLEKSIAVLPFDNIGYDTLNGSFSEGVLQAIIDQLYKIDSLKIPPPNSTFKFRNLSIREIATKLDVSYVLQGNVSESGGRLRVIVNLYRGKDEKLIWHDNDIISYTAFNLFEIQSSIAKRVAEKININISPDVKKRIEYKPTNSYEAYKLFLQAESSLMITDNAKGKLLLEQAISIDSSFADAYGLLAMYLITGGTVSGPLTHDEVIEKAHKLLSRAFKLDENSITAHVSSAMIELWYNRDFEATGKEYDIVRQLSPSGYYPFFTSYLVSIGKFDEAVILAERCLKLDKNSAINWGVMMNTMYFDGQIDNMEKIMTDAINYFRDDIFILINVTRIFTYQERYEEEISLFSKYEKKSDLNNPVLLGHRGIAHYKTGDMTKARECLNKLLSQDTPFGSPSFYAAALYATMGDNNNAIKLLEKSLDDHEVELYMLNIEPLFKLLHDYQSFNDLLKKVGFN